MLWRIRNYLKIRKSRKQDYITEVLKAYRKTWRYLAWRKHASELGIFFASDDAMWGAYWMDKEIYRDVKRFFPEQLVPFAAEAFHTMDGMCFERCESNLLKFIMFDDVAGNGQEDALRTHQKKLFYLLALGEQSDEGGRRDMAMDWLIRRDFYHMDLDYCEEMLTEIRGKWREYFTQVVFPIIKEIHCRGIWGPMFAAGMETTCDMLIPHLDLPEELDREAVRFLAEDALFYVCGANCSSYNPYWIFGSAHYEDLISMVWELPTRKQVQEWEKESGSEDYVEQINYAAQKMGLLPVEQEDRTNFEPEEEEIQKRREGEGKEKADTAKRLT